MNSNAIDLWAESFASQNEAQFFSTIRLYLGDVKTPYNKQKLTSQLATFIHKPENIQSILALLDNDDVNILTAINLIPKASQKNIGDFFQNTYTFSQIYTLLCNLTNRLVLYITVDKYTQTEYYHINPLLKEYILPYLSLSKILPSPTVTSFSYEDNFTLSPNFLAGFISYLKIQGCSCKADGSIKKNDLNRLEVIFPGKAKCMQYLVNAFINLSLLKEGEKNLVLDSKRLENFALLNQQQQYAFLCAASVSRFGRDGLKKEAQLLIDSLSAIPVHGYTRNTILRLAFLTGTYTEDGSALAGRSRFSQMLEQSKSQSQEDYSASLLDRMIDSAIEFGLLQETGKTENGDVVYVKGEMLPVNSDSENVPKVLNIESTFSATLMPGLSLKELLPLTDFMSIKKFGVVTEFEITKASASYSFDKDWTPESIAEEIEKHTYYELPQNLKINISDWYNSYTSAVLYHGYVLKVSQKNINITENNPKIAKYIKEKLAEGIYLLNIPANADISSFASESGLEFMGNIKTASHNNEILALPPLRAARTVSIGGRSINSDFSDEKQTSIASANTLLSELREELKNMDVPKNTKESLSHRIENRLILSKEQLKTASIRTEILEADGMDFNGKVHLADTAMEQDDMLELQMPNPNGDGSFINIVGKALQITKHPGEAIIRFQFEPGKEIENILISRITHLRRLRF